MALKLIEQKVYKKNKVYYNIVLQIILTISAMYFANKIAIDVWRSMKGH